MMNEENSQTYPAPTKKPLPQKTTPSNENLSESTWILMFGTALLFDTCKALIQFVPIVGQIIAGLINLFALGTFMLWFKIKEAKYSKTTFFTGFIVDFIPVLNILPEISLTIAVLFIQAKGEKILEKVPGGQLATKAIQGKIRENNTVEPDPKNDLRTSRSSVGSSTARQPVQNIADYRKNPNSGEKSSQPEKGFEKVLGDQDKETRRKARSEEIRSLQESNLKIQKDIIIHNQGGQEKWDRDRAETERKWKEHTDADKKVDDAFKQSKANFGLDKTA